MNRFRLRFSKSFAPGTAGVEFGRYFVRVVPSDGTEAVLEFTDSCEPRVGNFHHPVGEADIVSDVLSLILEAQVESRDAEIDYVQVPKPSSATPLGTGVLEISNVGSDFRRVLSMDMDLARRFRRSCRAYTIRTRIPALGPYVCVLFVSGSDRVLVLLHRRNCRPQSKEAGGALAHS